jgi:hypothetical protein
MITILLFLLAFLALWNSGRFGAMADLRTDEPWDNKIILWFQEQEFLLGKDLIKWYNGEGKWNQKWLWTQDFWHFCRDMERFLELQASIAFFLGIYMLAPATWWIVLLSVILWEITVPFIVGMAFTWFYHYKYNAKPIGPNFWSFLQIYISTKDNVTQ